MAIYNNETDPNIKQWEAEQHDRSMLVSPSYREWWEENKSAVRWLKQQYMERGETLPSGVFQEALEMEQKQMKEMYLRGIENYDPTFKRKSQWTSVDNSTKLVK